MAKRGTREEREARQRLRTYEAKRTLHSEQVRRRRRDNAVATIGALVVIALAVGAQLLYFTAGPGTPVASPTATPTPTPSPTMGANSGDVPDPALAEGRTWTGPLTLNDVALDVSLDGAAAPQGVAAVLSLAQSGFYTGKSCHRLTTGGSALLQCGSAGGDGSGDAGFRFGPIEAAPEGDLYPAGTIALARAPGDGFSMSTQFFVVYEDTTIRSDAAGGYTVIGTVTGGLDQLKTVITDAGETDGDGDGPPAVPTSITAFTLQ
ncbi:MAG: peptidylprolyl isomerase [Naasia sp.]|nr:peptidylprolyl isomerase [Naasia sp.]